LAGGGADGEPHGRRRRPGGAVLDAGCGDRVSWEPGSVALLGACSAAKDFPRGELQFFPP